MESNTEKKKGSLTDLEEGTCLTFPQYGFGTFLIGLSSEDKLCMVNWDEKDQTRLIVVELLRVEQTSENEFYATPITLDLPCLLNRNLISERQQLPKECKLEIGAKVIKFSDGTKKSRKLPPTPGVMILPNAPPKPKRINEPEISEEDAQAQALEDSEASDDSWQIEPSSEMVPGVNNTSINQPSDQIASVAASHVVRQMMLYTDLKMSVTMMDELYKAFKNVVEINEEILQDFLSESKKEMEQNKRASLAGQFVSQPLHGPVIILLVELLKHSLDPVSHVILWLLFLRTLSHFTQNLEKLVVCQAAAAIMGSMSVYLEVPEIQQYSLEILCKLATYKPTDNEKAPVRETGVEMILRAMKFHDGALPILRPACRALANLACTVSELISQSSMEDIVQKRRDLLLYIQTEAVPVVQDIMSVFSRDLGIQLESRRLMGVFATEHSSSSGVDLPEMTEDELVSVDDNDEDQFEEEDDLKPGILKSARSFENLRSPSRKVQFTSETFGGSTSCESIFSDVVENSGRFDSGSSRFTDSFGNEMDMPDSATYIGEETMFFPSISSETLSSRKHSGPSMIYVPSLSNTSSDTGQIAESTNGEPIDTVSGETHTNAQNADIDKDINQNSEAALAEKADVPSVNNEVEAKTLTGSNNAPEDLSPVATGPPPPVPPRKPLIPAQEQRNACNNYKPTVEDIQFLTRLMRTVITGHICSLVISGEGSQALQAIDQPLETLLKLAKANDFLYDNIAEQYQLDKTLMDIDPVMVISIIDAVRYRSLTFDLLKSSLTELLCQLADNLTPEVAFCAFDSIYNTIADPNLEPVFLERKFIRKMMKSLPEVHSEFLKSKVNELESMLSDLL